MGHAGQEPWFENEVTGYIGQEPKWYVNDVRGHVVPEPWLENEAKGHVILKP